MHPHSTHPPLTLTICTPHSSHLLKNNCWPQTFLFCFINILFICIYFFFQLHQLSSPATIGHAVLSSILLLSFSLSFFLQMLSYQPPYPATGVGSSSVLGMGLQAGLGLQWLHSHLLISPALGWISRHDLLFLMRDTRSVFSLPLIHTKGKKKTQTNSILDRGSSLVWSAWAGVGMGGVLSWGLPCLFLCSAHGARWPNLR